MILWLFYYVQNIPKKNVGMLTLQFAGDQITIAEDKSVIKWVEIKKKYIKWGLPINTIQIRYMCIWNNVDDLKIFDNDKIKNKKINKNTLE